MTEQAEPPAILARGTFDPDAPDHAEALATFAREVQREAARLGVEECLLMRKLTPGRVEVVVLAAAANPSDAAGASPGTFAVASEEAVADVLTRATSAVPLGIGHPEAPAGLAPVKDGGVGLGRGRQGARKPRSDR